MKSYTRSFAWLILWATVCVSSHALTGCSTPTAGTDTPIAQITTQQTAQQSGRLEGGGLVPLAVAQPTALAQISTIETLRQPVRMELVMNVLEAGKRTPLRADGLPQQLFYNPPSGARLTYTITSSNPSAVAAAITTIEARNLDNAVTDNIPAIRLNVPASSSVGSSAIITVKAKNEHGEEASCSFTVTVV